MKPADRRWYRDVPTAPHESDIAEHPVEFMTKVALFGFWFGKDRIWLAEDMKQCERIAWRDGPRCKLVSGHGGCHECDSLRWGEPMEVVRQRWLEMNAAWGKHA